MRKISFLILTFFSILIFFNLADLSAVGEATYCCEKTTYGSYCQNEPVEKCSTEINPLTKERYKSVPTSCEGSGYCMYGTCIDLKEGECLENTAQIVCDKEGGYWDERSLAEIPQCSLGCCVMGDQAAFVTQTRCKQLSSQYGLETNFRKDVSDEVQCIASTTSNVKGACVYEKDLVKTCRVITQKECKVLEDSEENVEFHQGYLCSAEELETICGRSEKTTCVDGKDEVYFVDTCGNIANIYDANKVDNPEYWTKIKGKDESCGYNSGNAGSSTCGNCDYFYGSLCAPYDRTKDKTSPKVGENICRDLSCNYNGVKYDHGETWCSTNSKLNSDLPGTEYFRMVCYNSEVTVEPCAALRGEICIQSETDGFSSAACAINRWQDCIAQTEKIDCENTDKRDCKWIRVGVDSNDDKDPNDYIMGCVPLNPPGFDFWNSESEAEEICNVASQDVTIVLKRNTVLGAIGADDWGCAENCWACHPDDWDGCYGQNHFSNRINMCSALGDCGKKENYAGFKGYKFDEKYVKIFGVD